LSLSQPYRPIVDIFSDKIADFSKYRLAKSFIKWSEKNKFSDLKPEEIQGSIDLIDRINKALK